MIDKLNSVDKSTEPAKRYPSDRLCEYITGLGLTDPGLGKRILEDRNIIRGKYDLLSDQKIDDISFVEYKDWIEKRLQKEGYKLRPSIEIQGYFQEGEAAAVTFIGDKTVYYSPAKGEGKVMNGLEHELIHVLQGNNMPYEAREYEAHIGASNVTALKKMAETGNFGVLFRFIVSNLRGYYRENNQVAFWDIK